MNYYKFFNQEKELNFQILFQKSLFHLLMNGNYVFKDFNGFSTKSNPHERPNATTLLVIIFLY